MGNNGFDAAMELRLLGPIEVSREGVDVEIGGARQRALLALLVIHKNEVLSRDRMIDDLWDEPPPGAAKALQIAVSRLRKLLPAETIRTDRGGYGISAGSIWTDADAFERLTRQAREGSATRSLALLDEALGLWRGEALGDLDVPFARRERARLEELRLAAIEERFEALLALGRDEESIAGLTAFIQQYPIRERPRAQLMLALYRAGRQRDALALYGETRRMLVDEAGIEPGEELQALHRSILQHDPALQMHVPPRVPTPRRNAWHKVIAAGLGAVAIAAGAIAVWSATGGALRPPRDSVVWIDAKTGRPEGYVRVGRQPVALAVGTNALWVASSVDSALTRIDPRTGRIAATVGLPAPANTLAVAGGFVWAGAGKAPLMRVDATSGRVAGTTALSRITVPSDSDAGTVTGLAGSGSALWVAAGSVRRLNGETGVSQSSSGFVAATGGIVAGPASVWAVDRFGGILLRLSHDARVVQEVPIGDAATSGLDISGPTAVAIGGDAVWAVVPQEDKVWGVDAQTGVVTGVIRVGDKPSAVAYGAGALFVANTGSNSVSEIDARTGRVQRTINLGRPPTAVAVADGRVWVAVQ